jgi:RHS repeat-associated protein
LRGPSRSRPQELWRFDAGYGLAPSIPYNYDGSIATLVYPSGHAITYTPSAAAQHLSAVDSTGNPTINYALSASYTPPGELASVTLGQTGTFTGINLNQTFSPRLQPAFMRGWSTNGVVLDLSYCFYPLVSGACPASPQGGNNGNVTLITNNRDNTRSQMFTYDALNRIAIAQTTSTSSTTNCWSEQYGYDAWGNLLSITHLQQYNVCSGSGFILSASVQNYLTAGTNPDFTYDAAGNMTHNYPGGLLLGYDAENHICTVGGGACPYGFYPISRYYLYDGEGRRVAKGNWQQHCYGGGWGGWHCYYIPSVYEIYWYDTRGNVLVETDGGGNVFNEYVFFGGKRIARRDSGGNVDYYFADHLGTARVVSNAIGTLPPLDDSDFYPFGGERPVVSPSSGNTYKFTGKERDWESGLDNFGARYNSSQYGRFMTPDSPSYSNRKNPQSWNLYAYSLNNPVSFRDADGHDIVCANNEEQCRNDAAAATANAEAAKRVSTNTTTTQHSFLGIFHWTTSKTTIGISGDINSFRALSPSASKLADPVTSKQTVTVSYDQFAKPSFWSNGQPLNGGSMSYTASQGYNWQAFIDPNRTPGVVYDQDAVDQGIPQANTSEEFGHEVLGHVWGEMFGGAPAGTRGNMRDSIVGEDAVRALDPTRGQKGLESHHDMPTEEH